MNKLSWKSINEIMQTTLKDQELSILILKWNSNLKHYDHKLATIIIPLNHNLLIPNWQKINMNHYTYWHSTNTKLNYFYRKLKTETNEFRTYKVVLSSLRTSRACLPLWIGFEPPSQHNTPPSVTIFTMVLTRWLLLTEHEFYP